MQRFLCSEIVRVTATSRQLFANLEEIWDAGALLESEEPLEKGTPVELASGEVRLTGNVVRLEAHSFGWRVEVAFSPSCHWSPEVFKPQHLLDPAGLGENSA